MDDLVFVYCETIKKLRPKVAILENVPGIIAGKAKGYTLKIVEMLNDAGYDVQLFSLNSATMGVPQARIRIFFIARRKDLNLPSITFKFDLKPILFGDIVERGSTSHKELIPSIRLRWPHVQKGDENLKYADARYRNKTSHTAFFSTTIVYDYTVPGTLTSAGYTLYYDEARNLNDKEYVNISSFPVDYNFEGNSTRYVCGMSVPPLMIAQIAAEIKRQWF